MHLFYTHLQLAPAFLNIPVHMRESVWQNNRLTCWFSGGADTIDICAESVAARPNDVDALHKLGYAQMTFGQYVSHSNIPPLTRGCFLIPRKGKSCRTPTKWCFAIVVSYTRT